MAEPDFDVLIVGAGIAGISAGAHLKRYCPDARFAMLERRAAIGGTWDLFRYPGIRSDSDMYTLGFGFKPWKGRDAIAKGEDIRAYLHESVAEHELLPHIRLGHDLVSANWSADRQCWEAEVAVNGECRVISTRILHLCSGYYDYAAGYLPDYPGAEDFAGPIIHPQHWPEGLDVAGKRIVLIGSGATAVTLLPELAKRGADVTLVQRSPTYMIDRPARDRIALLLGRLLPASLAYRIVRARNVALQRLLFNRSRTKPDSVRRWLLGAVEKAMPHVDVAAHMTPRYNPWEQRLCLVPDGDFFNVLDSGQAGIVTGRISRFVAGGIAMEDGTQIAADIIVSATGLNLQLFGGAALSVDGKPLRPSRHLLYKGAMLDGVPNLLFTFGYTNASWTLKADLVARFLTRLLAEMRRRGARTATPQPRNPAMKKLRMIDFSSGYFVRARNIWPRQGDERPWRLLQDYYPDRKQMLKDPVDDGELTFG